MRWITQKIDEFGPILGLLMLVVSFFVLVVDVEGADVNAVSGDSLVLKWTYPTEKVPRFGDEEPNLIEAWEAESLKVLLADIIGNAGTQLIETRTAWVPGAEDTLSANINTLPVGLYEFQVLVSTKMVERFDVIDGDPPRVDTTYTSAWSDTSTLSLSIAPYQGRPRTVILDLRVTGRVDIQ